MDGELRVDVTEYLKQQRNKALDDAASFQAVANKLLVDNEELRLKVDQLQQQLASEATDVDATTS